MQQPMPTTMNMMPQFPSTNITTEQIQKYLDENKTLILAILDNQNLGKLAECAQYQAQLQKNLMYLAAIADAQPPTQQPIPPQMPPHPGMQQGVNFMQQSQGAVPHQSSGFPPKSPLQFTPQQMLEHQRQQQQLHHQQAFQGHMGIRPGVSNGLQGMHTEGNLGGSSSGGPSPTVGSAGLTDASRAGAGPGTLSSPTDAREGKPDGVEAGSGDGQGNQLAGNNSANEDLSNKKGSEDAK